MMLHAWKLELPFETVGVVKGPLAGCYVLTRWHAWWRGRRLRTRSVVEAGQDFGSKRRTLSRA